MDIPRIHKEFFWHIVTGFVATGAHYGLMAIVLTWISSAILASSVGFMAGALTRFLTAHKIVFQGNRLFWPTVLRFMISLLVQLLLNAALLRLLLLAIDNLWLSQVIATGLMVVLNFIIYKTWVFRSTLLTMQDLGDPAR